MSTTKATKAKTKTPKTAPVLHAPVEAILAAQPEAQHKPNAMDFAVQQLTAPLAVAQPVAPVSTVDTNSAEFKAALAEALANRVPVAAKSKEPKAPRVLRVEQNGIKRPASGLTAAVWALFDRISAEQKYPCSIAQARAASPTSNKNMLQSQYASWRKFNGIEGRIVAPVAAKVETDGSDETTS